MFGVVLLTVWLLLRVLAIVVDFADWVVPVHRVAGAAGLLAFLVGMVGLIVGGRREPAPPGAGSD